MATGFAVFLALCSVQHAELSAERAHRCEHQNQTFPGVSSQGSCLIGNQSVWFPLLLLCGLRLLRGSWLPCFFAFRGRARKWVSARNPAESCSKFQAPQRKEGSISFHQGCPSLGPVHPCPVTSPTPTPTFDRLDL